MDFFNYISIHTKLVNIRNTLHVTHADIIYRTWGDKIEYGTSVKISASWQIEIGCDKPKIYQSGVQWQRSNLAVYWIG